MPIVTLYASSVRAYRYQVLAMSDHLVEPLSHTIRRSNSQTVEVAVEHHVTQCFVVVRRHSKPVKCEI